MDTSFTAKRRIRTPREFKAVFDQGTKVTNRFFTLLALPNALSHTRLGLVVSKRVSPKAVVRNRIKRLLREAFRQHYQLLDAVDVVIIARHQVVSLDGPKVIQCLEALFIKLAGSQGA